MDIYEICLEEIALEGLDGITLSTLWLRLNQREEKISINVTEYVKESLWSFLLQHCSVEFFQLVEERTDPVVFNRFLGIDVATGRHTAMAPDELDLLQEVYAVKPVSHVDNIKGSCKDFQTRRNITSQVKKESCSFSTISQRYGDRCVVIVASQEMREEVLGGPGITPQTVQSLNDMEYCILERIGRSRWQGEIQTVLNNIVFQELKSTHIHYMMKSLFRKGLVAKQPYSYVRADKGNKVYQQILLHLPKFKRDARSMTDIRMDTICEILRQSDSQSIPCADVKQIIRVEALGFRKLVNKMVNAGYVKLESPDTMKNRKHLDKMMTLIKTPSEKQEEEMLEDEAEETLAAEVKTKGLVFELPIVLQGHRYIFSTGENGCSQANLLHMLHGYGSLEARHICRKVEKAKIVKMIMIDHGRQRTQKYIAKNFATNSSHTKQFLAERKKMKEILETSDHLCNENSTENTMSVSEAASSSAHLTSGAGNAVDEAGRNQSVDGDIRENEKENQEVNTANAEKANDNQTAVVEDNAEADECEDFLTNPSTWDCHQTTRKMKRTNVILSYINEQKVVEGFFTIQKLLQSEEKDEGLTTKICKKTVKRLVQRLNEEGLLKYFSVPITSNDCTVDVDFVVALDCDPVRWKTAVEQAQFKIYSDDSKRIANERVEVIEITSESQDTPVTLQNSLDLNFVKYEELKPVNKLKYGFQPKFIRMRIIHQYLWYLAYGHPCNDEERTLELLDYDKVKEYNKERNWKRYLPPTPAHPDFGPGWIQVGDAAVLLPLSIICQYHQYAYMIEGLDQYLNSSIQKNILVRHLPTKMKGLLLHKRKYLLSLIQVIEQLSFMGLITFNQQKKACSVRARKESEMIYLHKKVSIYDTRSSEKSYNEVSEGINYERISFTLDCFSDVEKYWTKLKDICLMTPLGMKINEESGENRRNYLKTKSFITEHVYRSNPAPCDDGTIPGDGKGAGGLDSSLFAHLYRNWFRPTKQTKSNDSREKKAASNFISDTALECPIRLPKLVPTTITLSQNAAKKNTKRPASSNGSSQQTGKKRNLTEKDVSTEKRLKLQPSNKTNIANGDKPIVIEDDSVKDRFEIVVENNVNRNERVKGGRGHKRKATSSPNPPSAKKKPPFKKQSASKRRVSKYTDLLDIQALNNLKGRFRVSFSPAEDEVLVMCKIASTVISRTIRIKGKHDSQHAVSGVIVRNILRSRCEESVDKTSYSVLRRIRVIMKNENAKICHDVSVAEILEDAKLTETIRNDARSWVVDTNSKEVIERLYKKIVEEVEMRFCNNTRAPDLCIPDTIEDMRKLYNVKLFSTPRDVKKARVVSDVSSISDITVCCIENLIYATLSLNEDEFSQCQADMIFKRYPESLISEVWSHIKSTGIICNKPDKYLTRQRGLSFAVPKYHLSNSHFQYLQTDGMWKTCAELSNCFKSLTARGCLDCVRDCTSGPVVIMNMMLLSGNSSFSIFYPPEDSPPQAGAKVSKASTVNNEEKSPTNSSIPDINSTNDVDLSDVDDQNDTEASSQRELYHLYKRKRYTRYHHFNKKTGFPIGIVNISASQPTRKSSHFSCKDDFIEKISGPNIQRDVNAAVSSMDSVKSPVEELSLENSDEEINLTVSKLVSEKPHLASALKQSVVIIENSKVLGIDFEMLKKKLSSDCHFPSYIILDTLQFLRENNLVYFVGVFNHRLVLRKYIHEWLVTGLAYKGNRRLMREYLRKKLKSFTKRHDGEHLSSTRIRKRPGKNTVMMLYDRTTSNDDDADTSSPTDDNSEESKPVDSSCKIAPLSDPASYRPIKFICRPWHNVCGEINYKTAKLLLTAVFTHILWNPGVNLRSVTERFISIIQKVAIVELIEKLVESRCIIRHTSMPRKPWKFFSSQVCQSSDDVTSIDDDYFVPTKDSIFRMSLLCKRFDKLQKERETSLSLDSVVSNSEPAS